MQEIAEIRQRLTNQDTMLEKQEKLLDEISKLLKGSINLNMQGLIPMMNEMKTSVAQVVSDVAHLERWKKREQESKGTFTIRTSVFITRVLAYIGAAATVIGIVLGVLQIIDWSAQKKAKSKAEIMIERPIDSSQIIFTSIDKSCFFASSFTS